MGKDKRKETARQEHKHNYDGKTVQEGNYLVVYCTCGAKRSSTYNPGGNK